MLYIKKTSPPAEYVREIAKLKSTKEWRDLSDVDTDAIRHTFDALPKDMVRASLLEDQHYLCAYCMRAIKNDEHTTIEHFKPLSSGKEAALDYNNFLAVCDGGQSTDVQNTRRILCCDASKGNQSLSVLNPLDAEITSHISYTRQGTIQYICPQDWDAEKKKAVDEDINKTLRLNGQVDKDHCTIRDTATMLVKNRKDAYETYTRLILRLNKQGKLTTARLEKEIQQLLDKQIRQEYTGVIVFFLKRKQRTLLGQR